MFLGDNCQSVERQHCAIAKMEHGECRSQHEERLALDEDTITARLVVGLAFLHAASGAVVDGVGRYRQHRDNGQDAENGCQPEYSGQT